MYVISTDFILKRKISIEKLGIVFRPLSSKEKKQLKHNISIVLNYKKEITDLYKKHKDDETNRDFLMDIVLYDKQKSDIVMSGYTLLERNFKFNSINRINYIVDHLMIIEYDEVLLCKYMAKENIKKFISNFLSVHNLYKWTLDIKKPKMNSNYSFILIDDIFFNQSETLYYDILINIIMRYPEKDDNKHKTVLNMVPLDKEYLIAMRDFIEKLNSDDVYKLIEIFDLLLFDSYTTQIRILNNVTIVECLIINEKDNIEKSYILKGGMILKEFLKNENKASNDAIKLLLTFVYNIRSDIIHGNIKKIENDLNQINQKNPKIKKLVGEVPDFLSKKERAFFISYTVSLFVARCVIRFWIDNPYKIKYLKNN